MRRSIARPVRSSLLWESERAVPPRVIWRRTLDDARVLSGPRPGLSMVSRCPARDAFRRSAVRRLRAEVRRRDALGPVRPVEIPGTGFRIAGYIDRLDISGDGRALRARLQDRPPAEGRSFRWTAGENCSAASMLSRSKALLGDDVAISASLLLSARTRSICGSTTPRPCSREIAGYLSQRAQSLLVRHAALIGPDTGGDYDDLAFALPANAGATYCKRKLPPATERLGDAAQVWEAQ